MGTELERAVALISCLIEDLKAGSVDQHRDDCKCQACKDIRSATEFVDEYDALMMLD